MSAVTPLRPGDWVLMPTAPWCAGGIGRVANVSPRCNGVDPCACCGFGVTVVRPGLPDTGYGFAPHHLIRLDRPAADRQPVHTTRGGLA